MSSRERHQLLNPGELPLVLLSLFRSEPRTGYQLMQDLASILPSSYRPSAGAVYPALKALEEEKLVTGSTTGRTRTFRPTTRGARLLDESEARVRSVMHRILAADAAERTAELARTVVDRVHALVRSDEHDVAEQKLQRALDVLDGEGASPARPTTAATKKSTKTTKTTKTAPPPKERSRS